MPPQNIALVCEDYFDLKVIGNQQVLERFSALSISCLKAGHRFPFVSVSAFYQAEASTPITRDETSLHKQTLLK